MDFTIRLRAAVASLALIVSGAVHGEDLPAAWKDGKFLWKASEPFPSTAGRREEGVPTAALKYPSIVFHEGRLHLCTTLLMSDGQVMIKYVNFADWTEASRGPSWIVLLGDKFYAAPQVFYFTPHRRWYLICQTEDPQKALSFQPSFSTTETLADRTSWTKMEAMLPVNPPGKIWLDFWVICDAQKAHLFYTTQDGKMWRRETALASFPHGWSEPILALEGDFFEASHTYKLKDREQYLTLVEAQTSGRRYYKAYVADRLEGPWRGVADSLAKPFAARENVRQSREWTTSISHGELIREGVDERLEIDPENLRFLFQGVDQAGYRRKYNEIPWRLGILEPVR